MKNKNTIPRVELMDGEITIKMNAAELVALVSLSERGYKVIDPELALKSFSEKLKEYSEVEEDDVEEGDLILTVLQDAFDQVADQCYVDSEPGFDDGEDYDYEPEEEDGLDDEIIERKATQNKNV